MFGEGAMPICIIEHAQVSFGIGLTRTIKRLADLKAAFDFILSSLILSSLLLSLEFNLNFRQALNYALHVWFQKYTRSNGR